MGPPVLQEAPIPVLIHPSGGLTCVTWWLPLLGIRPQGVTRSSVSTLGSLQALLAIIGKGCLDLMDSGHLSLQGPSFPGGQAQTASFRRSNCVWWLVRTPRSKPGAGSWGSLWQSKGGLSRGGYGSRRRGDARL